MQRLLILVLVLCCSQAVRAGTVDTLEYYIDTDPGVGSATQMAITAGSQIDELLTIPTSAQSLGQHRLYFRVRDSDGDWSVPYSRAFFVVEPLTPDPHHQITGMEYYFDIDPGHGAGIAVTVPFGETIDQNFSVDVSALPLGPHRLYSRVRDEAGSWSVPYSRAFFVKAEIVQTPVPDITYLEYYVDTDPGWGNGAPIPIGSANVVGGEIVVDLTGLGQGSHFLYVRAKDGNGEWSVPWASPLTVDPTITDTDLDGIADSWEELYFGDLTTLGTNLDYDGDGYSDLQEYLNSMNTLDSDSNIYDPTETNASGGPGWQGNGKKMAMPWLFLLLNNK